MKCHLCGAIENLEKCPFCKKTVCKDCIIKTEVGRVCKKCDEEVARQLKWNGWELEIEKEENE